MVVAPSEPFGALAYPTRRAIFERLCRDGEQTVGALTGGAGVSQPAVSKHLGVLKHAGLVRDRRAGRHPLQRPAARSGAADRPDEPLRRLLARPLRSGRVSGPETRPTTRARTTAGSATSARWNGEEWQGRADPARLKAKFCSRIASRVAVRSPG